MGFRRWYRAGEMERHYMEDWPPVRIACLFCRLESEDRSVPGDGFKSVAEYVKHYSESHMGVHGLISTKDVRLQTVKWEEERLRREKTSYLMRGGILSNRFEGYFVYRGLLD